MAKVSMSLRGAGALHGRIMGAAANGKPITVAACERVLRNTVFPETQRQVPEDRGVLRSTGKVRKIDNGAEIVYGPGGAEDYAVIQHEREDFHHPKPGAKAKYVEDPMKAAAANLEQLMAGQISSEKLFSTTRTRR